jgi:hypothetical protein
LSGIQTHQVLRRRLPCAPGLSAIGVRQRAGEANRYELVFGSIRRHFLAISANFFGSAM